MRWLAALMLFVGALCSSTGATAATKTYALVVGNNAPPSGSTLPMLKYSDDDAVRYYELFQQFADVTKILSVLDADTQRRYPTLPAQTVVPTLMNVRAVVKDFAVRMSDDRARGDEAIFYFAFSGHGSSTPKGEPFLAVADGELTQQILYDEIIGTLPTRYTHLFVDACHAGAIVGVRGSFDREVEATTTPVSAEDEALWISSRTLSRFPHVGAVVATSSGQETHEWSRIEAGVFTHELVSGLRGPADVNHDGLIEYTEVLAFVAAANRDMKDPRAAPRILARAPDVNRHAPLVAYRKLQRAVFLTGDARKLGRFYIERADGQRVLDAHFADSQATIALPQSGIASFVRTANDEAQLPGNSANDVRLSMLTFAHRGAEARGSIDEDYRKALFASPFGTVYYKGFIDSTRAIGVQFGTPLAVADTPEVDSKSGPSSARRTAAISAWAVGGGAAILSVVSAVIALNAKSDFDDTTLQRPAVEAKARFDAWRTVAIASGAVAAAGGVAGWLLWPSAVPAKSGGTSFGIHARYEF